MCGAALCFWLAAPLAAFAQNGEEPIKGLVPNAPAVSSAKAAKDCVELPVAPADDRLQGPHGDRLIRTSCEVVEFHPAARWATALYRWNSVFTAEDSRRGPDARDTAQEDEAVVFDSPAPGMLRPVWHARIDTGPFGVYRSVTPEIASIQGSTLLSVMLCVNGTGGCGQDFLVRGSGGKWQDVRQQWLKQLPAGYSGRIRHGTRIEPRTLKGEAGFYADGDANCCPSQVLKLDLALKGDALVLAGHHVTASP
jgi:hypothetical protein